MKAASRISALMLVLLTLAACSSITSARVQKITRGMSPEQVTTLLGQPEHIDHAEITGLTGDVYDYGKSGAHAQVVFVNGAVFSTQYTPASGAPIRLL